MELSFEKNLWGQYDKLHERLIKKITYYENTHKIFNSIHSSFQDIMKKLGQINIIMDPTIFQKIKTSSSTKELNQIDSEYYGFPLIMKTIKDYLKEAIDFNNQTLENVLNNITTLLNRMNGEKKEYEEFLKTINDYLESKKIMEQNMKVYHIKAKAAEQSVYDFKKLEIKYSKINMDEMQKSNINKIKESSFQLVNDSYKCYQTYKESIIKANKIREELIRMEKLLLYNYQKIEQETGKINTSLSFLFSYNQNIQKEIAINKLNEMENIKKTLNVNKDIRQLILDYSGNNKPYEEIKLKYFDSFINFDKSDNNEEYQIYLQTILYIKNINNEEYPDFNQDLEKDKNDMRNSLYKIFSKYNDEDAEKLKKYIKNNLMHKFFLILLSKLRSNNRSNLDIKLLNLLGFLFEQILEDSEKNKNYSNAKNCIILSQTYCYITEKKEKKYLLEKIQNNKWLSSTSFWEDIIDKMINYEINKSLEIHKDIKKEDFENPPDNINDKTRLRLSEILFSQLLPYVNNMKEFKIDPVIILKITDNFCNKYKILTEGHLETIYSIISEKKEEIQKLREKYKNNIIKK